MIKVMTRRANPERSFEAVDNEQGPATFVAGPPTPLRFLRPGRSALMSIMPPAPGEDPKAHRVPTSVYLYYDKYGVLLYVGITSRGIARNLEHNNSKEWFRFVAKQQVEHHKSRGAALNRENYLIRNFHPPFNKQGNPAHHEMREAYYLFRETPGPARREFLSQNQANLGHRTGGGPKGTPLPHSEKPLPKTVYLRIGATMGDGTTSFTTTEALPFNCPFECSVGLRAKNDRREQIGTVEGVSGDSVRLKLSPSRRTLLGLVASVRYPPLTGTCQIMSLRACYSDHGLRSGS